MGKSLTRLKGEWPELNEVYSKCIRPELEKLYANLAALEEMIEAGHMARSVCDATWSSLISKIAYKAESASKLFVQVEARGTSQECLACGRVEKRALSLRAHECSCGCTMTRDHASSLVILDRGFRRYGRNDRNSRLWTLGLYWSPRRSSKSSG